MRHPQRLQRRTIIRISLSFSLKNKQGGGGEEEEEKQTNKQTDGGPFYAIPLSCQDESFLQYCMVAGAVSIKSAVISNSKSIAIRYSSQAGINRVLRLLAYHLFAGEILTTSRKIYVLSGYHWTRSFTDLSLLHGCTTIKRTHPYHRYLTIQIESVKIQFLILSSLSFAGKSMMSSSTAWLLHLITLTDGNAPVRQWMGERVDC